MSSVMRSSCARGRRRARRLLAAPLVPGAVEEERLRAAELEHRGRHGLEEPAVVGDEDHRGVERRQLALEPLEVLDVEVVRRLVEQQQVGIGGEGARERGARQLAARERVERPVEVGVDESEAADDRRRAVAPGPAAGVLEPRLRLAVASQRRVGVVAAGHRLLQSPQLVLDRDEVFRAGERVLPQREPLAARRALVVQCDARVLRKRELSALDATSRRSAPAGASSCPPRSGLRARGGRPGAAGTRPRRRAGRRRTPCAARTRSARPWTEGCRRIHGRVRTVCRPDPNRVVIHHGNRPDRHRRRRPRGRAPRGRVPGERWRGRRHDPLSGARSAVSPSSADEGIPARRAGPGFDASAAAARVGGGRRGDPARDARRGDPPGRARGRAHGR